MNKLTLSLITIALAASMLLSGCGGTASTASEAASSEAPTSVSGTEVPLAGSTASEAASSESSGEAEAVQTEFDPLELSAWNGTWNSMFSLLSTPEFEAAYPKLAEGYDEPMTPEATKADYEASYKTDFMAAVVEGDTIKFYAEPAAADGSVTGEPVYTGTYTADGIFPVIETDYSYAWYQFKAAEAGPYQYIVMLPAESAEEGGFAHWHYRVGSESFDALLKMEEWWPTSITPDTTAAKVVEVYTAE